MTAIQVLSEIRGDISVFPTAKNIVSWAECCPRNDQSNRKIKFNEIFYAGSYFKPVLVQVANALDRYLHILTDLIPYTSEGFLEQRPVNESKILTTSQALNLLKQRGHIIKDKAVPVA